MIIRHSEQQVQDYYGRTEMNQSSLKIILNDGIQVFQRNLQESLKQEELYYEEKKHFVIGQAVDCYLTHGKEIFDKKYFISQLTKKPSDTVMSIIKMTFDKLLEERAINLEIYNLIPEADELCGIEDDEVEVHIISAIQSHEYYSNWKMETKVKKVREEGLVYWTELQQSVGKQILSTDEFQLITAIVNSFTDHIHTSDLFRDSEDIDIIYQYPVIFEYKDVACKGLIDMIIINHKTKKIIPIDIKTMGDYVLKFNKAIKKRRYDIQASFYTYGINYRKSDLLNLCNRTLNVSEYEIAHFAFMVESTIAPGTPMIYVLNPELLVQGQYGNAEEDLQGWVQAIELYKLWNGVDFSLERKFQESNGVVWVNDNYEYDETF